jgi:aryl-alcohol dehydrogenase-like predicted oxidoreductase
VRYSLSRDPLMMERTDWLDEGLNSSDARFLMLTAITHHRFSSPIWGAREVRKLDAELAELDWLVTQAVVDAVEAALG